MAITKERKRDELIDGLEKITGLNIQADTFQERVKVRYARWLWRVMATNQSGRKLCIFSWESVHDCWKSEGLGAETDAFGDIEIYTKGEGVVPSEVEQKEVRE